MVLPEGMEKVFKDRLLQFEEERKMLHVSSIQRLGRKEGQNEGVLVGKIQKLQSLLGEEETSTEKLLSATKEELQARHDLLESKIRQKLKAC